MAEREKTEETKAREEHLKMMRKIKNWKPGEKNGGINGGKSKDALKFCAELPLRTVYTDRFPNTLLDTLKGAPAIDEIDNKDDPKCWLAAVGPDGMILGGEYFKKSYIENGIAMGKAAYTLWEAMQIEGSKVAWYYAQSGSGIRYSKMLKNIEPHKVYQTIDEMGTSCFKLVQDMTVEPKEIEPYHMILHMKLEDGTSNMLIDTTIEHYEGMLGLHYLRNKFFRIANEALLNTKFADVPWDMEEDYFIFDWDYVKKIEGYGRVAGRVY